MPAFLVGTVTVRDPERYGAYGAAIKGISTEFGGESLVSGVVATVFEGDSPVGQRVVVSRFATREDAEAYLADPRYVAAKALRVGAADVQLRLIVT